MSALTVYTEQAQVLRHSRAFDEIAAELAQLDVQFERWQANIEFGADAEPQTVLDAYQQDIERLNQRFGFQSVDVISVKPDHPSKDALRNKFLAEHTHGDFEVRFFVEGKGLFFLHVNQHVYAVLCEQGDLISVPANTPHWFDMGSEPDFKCIRLFTTEDGWVADFTGSTIALSFPSLPDYCAAL